jgi:hypothetical protein
MLARSWKNSFSSSVRKPNSVGVGCWAEDWK